MQAIIFDIGGVLLRTHDHAHRHKWDRRLGVDPGTVEYTVFNSEIGTAAQTGRITTEQLWQRVGRKFELDTAALTELRHDFWAGDQFDHQMVAQVIRPLRDRYQTAVISNAFDDLRQVLTDEFAAADAFNTITVSAEEKVMKPDAAIYTRTLDRLKCAPEAAVFIDDSHTNVAGARAVGMKAVHYTAGQDVAAALAAVGIH